MTAQVILIEAQPALASTGAAVDVRLAGGGAEKPYYYGGNHYQAGIESLPTIIQSLEFNGYELGTGGVPSATEIRWAPAKLSQLATAAAYFWNDAPITVRIGPEGTLPAATLTGKVLEATAEGGSLRIALADPAADLKKPFPVTRFLGTGGLEGPAEWEGTVKRRLFGRVWNVRGEPIDKANNVYCYADPTRPLQSIDAVRDKGAPAASLTTLAWAGSAAATFAALQAATAPQGGGVICPSIACVKWWTQPAGDLTADLKGEVGAGYVETTAEIAQRLVAAAAGPAFAGGTVAAATALRPAPVGWVIKDENTATSAMLDELLGNSSLLWVLSGAGEIVIREWAWGASVASAKSHEVSRKSTFKPLATRKIGYRRNELVQARGDLAAIVLATDLSYLDGTPVEALKPAEAGANVTGTNIAAGFIGQAAIATDQTASPRLTISYSNVRPAGQAINRNDSFELWDNGAPIGWTKDVGAAGSGTPVLSVASRRGAMCIRMVGNTQYRGDLLPVRAGEKLWLSCGLQNISFASTGNNPGQGRWYIGFRANKADGSLHGFYYPVSSNSDQGTGYKDLSAVWTVPSDVATIELLVLFEYANSASNGVGDLDYYSVSRVQDGADVTGANISAGFTGQGTLATRNDVLWASHVFGRPNFLTDTSVVGSDERVKADYVWSPTYSSTIQARWPAELGANVTETRTAAAITGQGGLATRNNARIGWELVDEAGSYLPPAYIKNNNNTAAGSGFVARPVGGEYSNNAPNLTGAIQIKLPNTVGDQRFCMIKFQVDIFDYNTETTVTYDIAGYVYAWPAGPGWINCTAKAVGGSGATKPVRFGRTGNGTTDRFCVWIGDVSPASVWQYPQVQVRNVVTGYSYYDIAYWQAGWETTLVTAAFPAVDATIANPTASDAVFGINARESWNGAVATLPNFKTPLGTAAAITGQTDWATFAGISTSNMAGRVARLDSTNGRAVDGRLFNSNNNYGLRALSVTPTMSGTSTSTASTVTFGSNGVLYSDWGAQISLPAGSFPGLLPNTSYYFWRNMPSPDGAGSSYGYSTSLLDALGTSKVYLGSFTTPVAGGTGGAGSGYGGGSGGFNIP